MSALTVKVTVVGVAVAVPDVVEAVSQLGTPLIEKFKLPDEALTEYLRHGRPTCDAREIFVRHMRPIVPFANGNSHWAVMARALRAAGITNREPRRGFHLLRHSLATHLLGGGVRQRLTFFGPGLVTSLLQAAQGCLEVREAAVGVAQVLRGLIAPVDAESFHDFASSLDQFCRSGT